MITCLHIFPNLVAFSHPLIDHSICFRTVRSVITISLYQWYYRLLYSIIRLNIRNSNFYRIFYILRIGYFSISTNYMIYCFYKLTLIFRNIGNSINNSNFSRIFRSINNSIFTKEPKAKSKDNLLFIKIPNRFDLNIKPVRDK